MPVNRRKTRNRQTVQKRCAVQTSGVAINMTMVVQTMIVLTVPRGSEIFEYARSRAGNATFFIAPTPVVVGRRRILLIPSPCPAAIDS